MDDGQERRTDPHRAAQRAEDAEPGAAGAVQQVVIPRHQRTQLVDGCARRAVSQARRQPARRRAVDQPHVESRRLERERPPQVLARIPTQVVEPAGLDHRVVVGEPDRRHSADTWNKARFRAGDRLLVPCIVSDLSDYLNFRPYPGARMGILHREDSFWHALQCASICGQGGGSLRLHQGKEGRYAHDAPLFRVPDYYRVDQDFSFETLRAASSDGMGFSMTWLSTRFHKYGLNTVTYFRDKPGAPWKGARSSLSLLSYF